MTTADGSTFAIVTFRELMALEPHGTDVFVGVGPQYPWGRVYGGQVAAQALRAAMHTVEPEYVAHSLHAYFIRGGDSSEPIRYEVDRIRNGRSFCTRRVVARQSGGAILNLSASFQVEEPDQADRQTAVMPDVPPPAELADDSWGTMLERRPVPKQECPPDRSWVWLRLKEPVADDDDDLKSADALHWCGQIFTSDDIPTDAAITNHPTVTEEADWENFIGASLDHAVWMHRLRPVTDWMLHDFAGEGLQNARGLARGQVFAEDGTHVASIAQEILFREKTH